MGGDGDVVATEDVIVVTEQFPACEGWNFRKNGYWVFFRIELFLEIIKS